MLITTYNPEPEQTDSTPCIAGGTGYNLCDMAREGKRTIALSQELLAWTGRGKLEAGTVITLVSENGDWRCNGEFILADALNARFTNRGDIFMMNPQDNTSCYATVYADF